MKTKANHGWTRIDTDKTEAGGIGIRVHPCPSVVFFLWRLLKKIPPTLFLFFSAVAFGQLALPPDPLHKPERATRDGREIFVVGFDKLAAFPYTIVDAGTGATPAEIEQARQRNQVPEWIRFYHEKAVLLTGYLMPLQLENGLAKKFVLMKDVNTCCYGATPNMNDYVVVTMKGAGVPPSQDVPVEIVGIMHVEEKYENGYITSLFRLDGEKFLGVKK